jgi:hypothetical protein
MMSLEILIIFLVNMIIQEFIIDMILKRMKIVFYVMKYILKIIDLIELLVE